jgi:hypothetical protein
VKNFKIIVILMLAVSFSALSSAHADEHLFGYVRGAEPQPEGTWEFYQIVTQRSGKGLGRYTAWDTETEIEYGFSDRFAALLSLQTLSIDTSNLRVDAYIPEDNKYSVRPSGIEIGGKYSYLTPAKDFIGLTSYTSLMYQWKDVHSGLAKDSYSFEYTLSGQKYFLEGELILTANVGMEATYALRADVANLPPDFEWPVVPEMEIETTFATGLSYRFMPNWFAGGETNYQTEYETEVGRERYSWFAGPSVHYGSAKWWGTLTYFKQLRGGEGFEEQDDQTLHLVEKTKNEIRLKVGLNF